MNVIEKKEGPCVVLAGAGTGKTYTIVEKIKHLINNKIYSPERIVCITFSNEAANNLLSRVRKFIEVEEEPIIRTFHAFSADLLREYGERIGISKNFRILDPDEAKVVLHRNLKVSLGNCNKYMGSIGIAKDLGISFESLEGYFNEKLKSFNGADLEKRFESLQFELQTLYLRNDKGKKKELVREAGKVRRLLDMKKFLSAWKAYEKIKGINNFQDYSDLNKSALELLKKNSEISENYDYIIVDEFQDTNKVQLDLVTQLARHGNITVVGDMNQSIYRFRGAYKENFEKFKECFRVSDNDIFSLDKSYRSSNKILRAAHKLILNNYFNKDECFMVGNVKDREGDGIDVYEVKDAREEARKVVELVESERTRGKKLEDICIMFRTHQQGRIIKQTLEFSKIPYYSVSKSSLLKQKSVRSVIDYLNILNKLVKKQKGGEQAWWDLIYQSEFSENDLIIIGKFIRENRDSNNIGAVLLNEFDRLELSDSGRLAAKVLLDRIKILIPLAKKDVPELLLEVYRICGLIIGDKDEKGKEIMLNLNKFYEIAKNYSSFYASDLSNFLHYLDIVQGLGIEIKAPELESRGVRLMTLHATKGLEYKTVIITNLAQKRFPIERISNNSLIPLELSPEFIDKNISQNNIEYYAYQHEKENQLLEERRLCYVAFTRAKEKLILTYANEYGGKRYYPSQFLHEAGYKNNPDFSFFVDEDRKYSLNEIKPKADFDVILKKDNFEELLADIAKKSDNVERMKLKKVFSPSSLLKFVECQKKYEYKYVYHMPEEKVVSWEAMRLGSFVHLILEKGVKNNFKSVKEFLDLAREKQVEEDWESVDLNEALHLIRVFFERNKGKYDERSKTEQKLNTEIGGIKFIGFADRIDFNPNGIEIIDYKTGKASVPPMSRNWQLGYYALAASHLGKVRRITLDMLKHEKPLEFEIDEKGNARAIGFDRMPGFNIYGIEQELIKTAHEVLGAYDKGFKPCSIEKNCEFCNEWVYGL